MFQYNHLPTEIINQSFTNGNYQSIIYQRKLSMIDMHAMICIAQCFQYLQEITKMIILLLILQL